MRLSITILLLCAATAVPNYVMAAQGAKRSFPYKAFISSPDVYVRSGPGKSYYPTTKLQPGDEVEVYRHDPGGWYAIRPPKDSFTWVAERYLERTGNGLGRVAHDRVAARVGSQFSEVRDVVQIRLNKGELVEILEEKMAMTNGSSIKWCKIAPPSGEFRWIFGRYADPDFPHEGIRKTRTNGSPILRPASDGERVSRGRQFYNKEEEFHRDSADQRSFAEESRRIEPRLVSPEEFVEQLADLDLELSVMVAEEPTVWQFDELSSRARSLLAQAETALERGKARVLLGKITRFDNIKQRYDVVNSIHLDTERENRQLGSLSRPRRESSRLHNQDDRFDGLGRLTRVTSPKAGSPCFALVDRSGDVSCYVSPAPGVKLRHYLGREIGVSGIRGYIPEHRSTHVMVKNVTALTDSKLR